MFLSGRTDTNKVVIIPNQQNISKADYVKVRITKGTSGTLFGDIIEKVDVAEKETQKIA